MKYVSNSILYFHILSFFHYFRIYPLQIFLHFNFFNSEIKFIGKETTGHYSY